MNAFEGMDRDDLVRNLQDAHAELDRLRADLQDLTLINQAAAAIVNRHAPLVPDYLET